MSRNWKTWTVEDDDYMRKNYREFPVRVVAKELGRTEQAVIRRAMGLGLAKGKSWKRQGMNQGYQYKKPYIIIFEDGSQETVDGIDAVNARLATCKVMPKVFEPKRVQSKFIAEE